MNRSGRFATIVCCRKFGAAPSTALSRQDFFHHVAVHVGEAKVSALEGVGEAFVVDAEQMQHGGVEIVNVEDVFDGVVAEFVGRTVGDSASNSPRRP